MGRNRIIRFKHNYGGKLYAKNFTTLRLYDSKQYVLNDVYQVYLDGEYLGTAQLRYIRSTRKSCINGFVAALDTGGTVGQSQTRIDKIHPSQSDQHLACLLFKWIRIDPGCSVDVKGMKAKLKKLERND